MAHTIDSTKFITALRLVVQALPFPKEDRAALLEAVELRAEAASKAKQRARDTTRPSPNREQLARHAANMRRYRAERLAKARQ